MGLNNKQGQYGSRVPKNRISVDQTVKKQYRKGQYGKMMKQQQNNNTGTDDSTCKNKLVPTPHLYFNQKDLTMISYFFLVFVSGKLWMKFWETLPQSSDPVTINSQTVELPSSRTVPHLVLQRNSRSLIGRTAQTVTLMGQFSLSLIFVFYWVVGFKQELVFNSQG